MELRDELEYRLIQLLKKDEQIRRLEEEKEKMRIELKNTKVLQQDFIEMHEREIRELRSKLQEQIEENLRIYKIEKEITTLRNNNKLLSEKIELLNGGIEN